MADFAGSDLVRCKGMGLVQVVEKLQLDSFIFNEAGEGLVLFEPHQVFTKGFHAITNLSVCWPVVFEPEQLIPNEKQVLRFKG